MNHFLYFAYGSNLHPARLRERTPSAVVLGTAVLAGHRLRFHKLGRDGSGKCDARWSGNPDDRVHGALYRIAEAQRPALDQAESLGVGYDALLLPVHTASGVLPAWTYRAREAAIAAGLVPFDWYLDFVLAGAGYHGFPADYVAALALTPSVEDPDAPRRARNRAVLGRTGAGDPRSPGVRLRQSFLSG